MKSIFYFMHVPWGWVRQRPHFLAGALAKFYSVDVYCRKTYRNNLLVKNPVPSGLHVKTLPVLPDLAFIPGVCATNRMLLKSLLRNTVGRYDIVWLTYPDLYEAIEDSLPDSAFVIYDCMDNALEFPNVQNNNKLRQRIFECEKRLIERSNLIFASSSFLKDVLTKRYANVSGKNISILNNGIALETGKPGQLLKPKIREVLKIKKFKMTYIGTISDWVNFDIVLEALNKFKDAVALFFGPAQVSVPRHERLFHFGPIGHEHVFEVMERSDILMMPFDINKLTLGVDPIKLYEYIFSCKPAVAVRYPETLKFGDYVHLYSGKNEFLEIISEIFTGQRGLKQGCDAYRAFALANTWEKRSELMYKLIQPLRQM